MKIRHLNDLERAVIERFVADRIEHFKRRLKFSCYIKFNADEEEYIVNAYKATMYNIYFEQFVSEIKDAEPQQRVRVELVLLNE